MKEIFLTQRLTISYELFSNIPVTMYDLLSIKLWSAFLDARCLEFLRTNAISWTSFEHPWSPSTSTSRCCTRPGVGVTKGEMQRRNFVGLFRPVLVVECLSFSLTLFLFLSLPAPLSSLLSLKHRSSLSLFLFVDLVRSLGSLGKLTFPNKPTREATSAKII